MKYQKALNQLFKLVLIGQETTSNYRVLYLYNARINKKGKIVPDLKYDMEVYFGYYYNPDDENEFGTEADSECRWANELVIKEDLIHWGGSPYLRIRYEKK